MIWDFSLPNPRVITIEGISTGYTIYLRASFNMPNLLHASFESRTLAGRYYQLYQVQSSQGDPTMNPFYLNLARDIVYITDQDLMGRPGRPGLTRRLEVPQGNGIQNIAYCLVGNANTMAQLADIVIATPHLRNLIIHMPDYFRFLWQRWATKNIRSINSPGFHWYRGRMYCLWNHIAQALRSINPKLRITISYLGDEQFKRRLELEWARPNSATALRPKLWYPESLDDFLNP